MLLSGIQHADHEKEETLRLTGAESGNERSGGERRGNRSAEPAAIRLGPRDSTFPRFLRGKARRNDSASAGSRLLRLTCRPSLAASSPSSRALRGAPIQSQPRFIDLGLRSGPRTKREREKTLGTSD